MQTTSLPAPRLQPEPTPAVTEPALDVSGLRKSYGSTEALAGVDLSIGRGEIFALLGPNGAGKTTLVEILEGYRTRSAGDVRVLGVDPEHGGREWKARLGIVLQGTTVFDVLTVREVVRHFAGFFPAPLDPDQVIAMVGLSEKRNARCKTLSGGQKRRVDLAAGIVGDPELLFLDEPTTGLDPQGRRQLWEVVRDFAALGKTVVLTTHYLEEAEALADRVGIIVRGELVALGTPREIGGRARARAAVSFELVEPLSRERLPALDGELAFDSTVARVMTSEPTAAVVALSAWARGFGVEELPGLTVRRPSLEDIYLEMARLQDEPEVEAHS